jgi:transcriptional/translational regulatory protein YebC/TACO1
VCSGNNTLKLNLDDLLHASSSTNVLKVLGNSGDEDQIMEVALDAGAQDVISNEDGSIDVVTTF